jgi:hydroxypyruvate isomerase
MSRMNRRQMLQAGAATAAAALASPLAVAQSAPAAATTPVVHRHNIHQSVSRWCYSKIPLEQLCSYSAGIGLEGIDLLQPEEWETPTRYGLRCTMGYANGGDIKKALNRVENHAAIETAFRKFIPMAAKLNVPNVITFSGIRAGMSDDEGARNCILGLKRVAPIAEANGVNICMELLNSKRDHKDYMCDHTAWGVRVMEEVNSTHVKLLYDIYHMQIMEGDLIATIKANAQWLGHFHTGGVPGRHELDSTQEIEYAGVMRGILSTGYKGYVAHEFVPARDPLTSLAEAAILCDV